MKIKVLYEDSNILAIEKPIGVLVHGDGRTKEKTLADWILKKYPKLKKVGEPQGGVERPGIVHRLDKETSGVMLLAKNQKSYEYLKSQFQNHTVRKVYYAIVSGHMRHDRGIVKKQIGRSPTDFRRYSSSRGAKGEMRDAVTEYTVIKRFVVNGHKMTAVSVRPRTGRTHQIRVHMKYLNHGIVGDDLYNPKGYCPKSISRMALHAESIEFSDKDGVVMKFTSKIPKELLVG